MKPLDQSINLDDEVRAIADFVSVKWTPIPNLVEIVNAIKDVAVKDARALFDSYTISAYTRTLRKAREQQLKSTAGDDYETASSYDHPCHLLEEIGFNASRVREEALNLDGQWRFESKTRPIINTLLTKYPEIINSRPHGWDELKKSYTDYAGMEEYDPEEDQNLFKGSRIESACAPDLTGRIALPYVMYDDRGQGRSPANTLISSIYAHFIGAIEYLNSHSLCSAIDALGLSATDEMVLNFNAQSNNPILKVLIDIASKPYTKEDYEESIKARAAFERLSPEEQKQRREENEKATSEMIANLLATMETDEDKAKELEKSAHIKNLLAQEFGT